MRKQIKAMFPGTFDPIHAGHIDLIKRCAKFFDKLYVAVAVNIYKKKATNFDKRLANAKKAISKLHLKNVEVVGYKGLTTDFARKHNVLFIVRGIRNVKDAKFEIDMAQVNNALNDKVLTVLMLPRKDLKNLSSTAIRYLKDTKK